jgi:hypothetical protein
MFCLTARSSGSTVAVLIMMMMMMKASYCDLSRVTTDWHQSYPEHE